MVRNVCFGLFGPIGGNLTAFEWTAGGCFSMRNGVLQHRALSRPLSGRNARITICLRVIANPKVDSAVSGQQNRIARDEIIVDPTRGRADNDSREKEYYAKGSDSFPSRINRFLF